MIIFLYGPDTYRSRQKLNEIVEHYRKIHKSGLNLKFFKEEGADFAEFQGEIKSISMFAEKKLIVLEGIFTNQDFKENFLKNQKEFIDSKDVILFYEKKEILKTNPLFKFLKKYAKCQEFELLDEPRLKNWIKKEVEDEGAKIDEYALQLLINFVGNNLWQISNEIKKLVSYRAPRQRGEGGKENGALFDHKNKKTIEEKDVKLLVKPKIETDIFETIDALSQRNRKKALHLLQKHLEKGDSPYYLFSMINFQFRNLLIMKPHELKGGLYGYNALQVLAKKLGIHPYVARKAIQEAKKFSFDELKKIYRKIFQIDLDIKTGKVEPETGLDLLIAGI